MDTSITHIKLFKMVFKWKDVSTPKLKGLKLVKQIFKVHSNVHHEMLSPKWMRWKQTPMLFITIQISFIDDLIFKIMGFFNIQLLGLLQSGHRQWFYFCTIGWINHYPFTSLSGFNGPSVHFNLMFFALIFMIFFSSCSSSLACVQFKFSSS